jgi:hypothetical protein
MEGMLYIDENGTLMSGEQQRSTSIVEGVRFTHNGEIGSYWDYEIVFINDLGNKCGENHKIIHNNCCK